MDELKARGIIEGILFTMGESVEVSRLASVLEIDNNKVKAILKEMEAEYAKEERGISLIWLDDAVQLCTKSE
ncbi:MAG: SMC-Scp complex subunit ScpB, partial [Lachnospiraceae bacterium]|nr:SMC-Scp complex subunit ScpB [Lachnospiraceae bacterium]